MSTMPKVKEYPDFQAYHVAFEAWAASPEGKAEFEEDARRTEEKEAKERERYEFDLSKEQIALGNGLGIPTRALAAASGALDSTEAMSVVDGATDFLVLSGGPGCGKTVAAAAWILSYVLDRKNWKQTQYDSSPARILGLAPIWVTAAKLARWERYDEDQMQKLLRTPRLVIDDLGGEYLDKGGFYASLLDEIVNERQAETKPTIMTTNLNAEAFKERYGERIIDRIREGGRFVGCGDHSLRAKKDAP